MTLLHVRKKHFWIGGLWVPVEFWPYTTVVLDRIVEFDRDEWGAEIDALREHLLKMFKEAGFDHAHLDNKIAFGVKDPDDGRTFYLGFYDGKLDIGTSYRTDDYNIKAQKAREKKKLAAEGGQ